MSLVRENPSLLVRRAAGAWDLLGALCRLVVIVVCCMELLVGASLVDLLQVEAFVFHLAEDRPMRVAWVVKRLGTFVGTSSTVVAVGHEVLVVVREDGLEVDDASGFARGHLPCSS